MNKVIYFISIIIVSYTFSCTPKKKDKADFQILFEESPMIKLSQIADSVKIIELQENDTSVLGAVSRIQLYKNNLFIDDFKNESVYRYTLEGEFINKIGHKGEDPEGYIRFGNSYIKNDTVYIQDYGRYDFVLYDLNGNFIKSIPLDQHQPIRDFVINDNGILGFYVKQINEPNSGVHMINKSNGSNYQLIKPEKEYLLNMYVQQYFCKLNDDEYGIVDYNNNKIYHINGDRYEIAYTFSVSKEVPESMKYRYSKDVDNGEYFNTYSHYTESNNFLIIMSYERMNQFYTTIYDKRSQDAITGSWKPGDGIIKDDLGNCLWYNFPVCFDNKLFVQIWDDENDLYKIEIVFLK